MHWHGFSSVWVLQWQQTYTASHINAVSVLIGLSPVCPNTNFKAKFILPVRWANPSEITLNWVMWGLSILVLSNKWKSFVTIEPLLLFPSVISPMVYMDTSLLLTNLCPRIWCLCEKSFVYIHHGVFTMMCLRKGSSFAIYSFIVCFDESVFVQSVYHEKLASPWESHITMVALKGFLSSMSFRMYYKIKIMWESLITLAALKWFLPSMSSLMYYKMTNLRESLTTLAALKWLLQYLY